MSLATLAQPIDVHAVDRASAKETLWRLAALALSHPIEPFHRALSDGRFHEAFDGAWFALTGVSRPRPGPVSDFESFEAGYIATFLHSRNGKPVASLFAADYPSLIRGETRAAFMLNVAAFYRHFGLRPAAGDEGRADEPDHLVCMLEFMAALAHLEGAAIAATREPDPFRRAGRDFLRRYLAPALSQITHALQSARPLELDAALGRLLKDLSSLTTMEIVACEAQVGSYRENREAQNRGTANVGLASETAKS